VRRQSSQKYSTSSSPSSGITPKHAWSVRARFGGAITGEPRSVWKASELLESDPSDAHDRPRGTIRGRAESVGDDTGEEDGRQLDETAGASSARGSVSEASSSSSSRFRLGARSGAKVGAKGKAEMAREGRTSAVAAEEEEKECPYITALLAKQGK